MTRDAVRMGFLRSSRLVGKPLKALRSAWDVRFVGLSEGPDHSTELHLQAPIFGEAAESLFKQGTLWDDGPNPQDTAFDLVGHVVSDVASRATDSERFDTGLLRRLFGFHSILKKGLDSISISGHRLPADHPPVIDSPLTDAARSLVEETPAPRRVRVQGTLDMIRVSDRVFELLLRDGDRLRAVWADERVVSLAQYLNRPVLIEGETVYRPSGSLLRLDTDVLTPSSEKDAFFSRMPTPDGQKLRVKEHRQRQTAATGFNAIYGRWPGDETDQEILNALAELD